MKARCVASILLFTGALFAGLISAPAAAIQDDGVAPTIVGKVVGSPAGPAMQGVAPIMVPRLRLPAEPSKAECGCCYEQRIEGTVWRHVQYEGTICTPDGFLLDYEPEGVHPDTWEYGVCVTNHFECPGGGSLLTSVLALAEVADMGGIARLARENPGTVLMNQKRNAVQIMACTGGTLMAHIPIASQPGDREVQDRHLPN